RCLRAESDLAHMRPIIPPPTTTTSARMVCWSRGRDSKLRSNQKTVSRIVIGFTTPLPTAGVHVHPGIARQRSETFVPPKANEFDMAVVNVATGRADCAT